MKIFTTALIALGPLTYALSAGANYNSGRPKYPPAEWSVAVIGGARDWVPFPKTMQVMYDATVTELTVRGDEDGRLQATVTVHRNIRQEQTGFKWKTSDYTPVVANDYPVGATRLDSFGQRLWAEGEVCPLDDLQNVDATVLAASALSNTPGTHTRTVTVELTGVNVAKCAILTSDRVRR